MTKRIQWNYESVKIFIENLGYELISKSFKNVDNKLVIKDSQGFYYTIIFKLLYKGCTPRKFSKNNPYTIQNIKLWCNLNNKPFRLLSEEYNGSHINLQWECLKEECGEIFEMRWDVIYSGSGCSYCTSIRVGLSNCLATKNPELASEWHPILNGDLTPFDVLPNSNIRYWWKCKECGHEWFIDVAHRNIGRGCPECNQSKGEKRISKYLLERNIIFIPQKEFDGLLGLGNGNLSYDFYLTKYNLLVEYQGEFHDGTAYQQSKEDFLKQLEHDRRKRDYAQNHNINLLEIWYWDFDKIEEVLMRELTINKINNSKNTVIFYKH